MDRSFLAPLGEGLGVGVGGSAEGAGGRLGRGVSTILLNKLSLRGQCTDG